MLPPMGANRQKLGLAGHRQGVCSVPPLSGGGGGRIAVRRPSSYELSSLCLTPPPPSGHSVVTRGKLLQLVAKALPNTSSFPQAPGVAQTCSVQAQRSPCWASCWRAMRPCRRRSCRRPRGCEGRPSAAKGSGRTSPSSRTRRTGEWQVRGLVMPAASFAACLQQAAATPCVTPSSPGPSNQPCSAVVKAADRKGVQYDFLMYGVYACQCAAISWQELMPVNWAAAGDPAG